MILACAKIQTKMRMFGEAGAPESSFGTVNYKNLRPAHFVNIRFI